MDKNTYEKLTDSAKKALCETLDEVREMIIDKAYQNANQNNTADKEISLRDIIEAKEEVLYKRKKLEINDKESGKKRVALILSMAGAAYAAFGIVFYLVQDASFNTTKDIGIIVTAVGILVSILSFYYLLLTRRKVDSSKDNIVIKHDNSEFEIVRRWQTIEKLGTELMLREGFSNDEAKSFNNILSYLSDKLTAKETYQLRKVLMARNRVVHNESPMSEVEVKEMIRIADEIIDELEKRANRNQ